MTIRTKLDIDWSEDALERAKQYAAKLIIKLQCLGYGVTDAPNYNKTFQHSIEFSGTWLGEVYCGSRPSKRVGHERDGVVFFNWRRDANSHDIVLTEGAGNWNYLEHLTKAVQRLDEILQNALVSVQHRQEANAIRAMVEAAEDSELHELQAELEVVTTERDAARRALGLANGKIEQLIQELGTVRRECDELRRWENLREKTTQAREAELDATAERKASSNG
jgi:hypothetical protein